MDKLELIDNKEQLKTKAEVLINNAEVEKRKLTDTEKKELDNIKNEIAGIEIKIKDIEEKRNFKTKTMENNFSLIKAINDVANNRTLDEATMEVVNAGQSEMRKSGQSYSGQIVLPVEMRADIKASVATAGQENVAEDKLGILEPLRKNLVLIGAGATYMTGLIGNVSIPVYSGSNVGWAGEVAAASDGAGTFSEVNLEPKRLTAYVDISKQFLIQDSNSAELMLKADIVRAISEKLESTVLGSAAGSTSQPAGIFNLIAPVALTPDFAEIVGLEETLETANVGGNKVYIVNPALKSVLRTTEKSAGTAKYLMENNEINGYPVLTTSASAGIVFGNFFDYVIGQWGGIDLTIDPYTQAANGKVRLVINTYFDAKPRRLQSFVTGEI
jgi:HK97 family phage major capsid protein